MPADGSFQPLNVDDFLGAVVRVDRVIGRVDRAVWAAVLIIIWIAILALISIAIIAVGGALHWPWRSRQPPSPTSL